MERVHSPSRKKVSNVEGEGQEMKNEADFETFNAMDTGEADGVDGKQKRLNSQVESAFLQEPGLKLAGPVEAQACVFVGVETCTLPIDEEQLALLTPVAFCHALGHVMSNVSFAAVAVSLTHTIKDPFADANDSVVVEKFIHIRNQQRNGKKSLTTVQGLKEELSLEKILKDLKEFCCNGNVGQNEELGKVIQLQGDQRKNVSNFLVKAGLAKKEEIKMHGF
ncbi:hypothetical protein Vadar_032522 [Vaccinium darrowii]|uniref:Uncharacterized protein n=1 Tax=Vaccinium darrowii TaxID=229202 RepID=A0ACB7X5M3_9ERIC|nr:hypothetical protein Vadar_032522 [Vaccinium darrowii]